MKGCMEVEHRVKAAEDQGDWGELLANDLCNTHTHTFICEIRPFSPHSAHLQNVLRLFCATTVTQ